jgi:hypothetical protein
MDRSSLRSLRPLRFVTAFGLPNPENPTTEANADEKVVIIQNEEPATVAANSSVHAPLDKRRKPSSGAGGCPVHTRSGVPQTQPPIARRSTWTNALRGEKSATFGHARKPLQTGQFHSQVVAL